MNKHTALDRRQMAENQVVFRRSNRQIISWIDRFRQYVTSQDELSSGLGNTRIPMQFVCECSDENCLVSITVPLNVYRSVHKSPDQFTIAVDHEVLEIEDVILVKPDYIVVKKHVTPSANVSTLHTTDVNNKLSA